MDEARLRSAFRGGPGPGTTFDFIRNHYGIWAQGIQATYTDANGKTFTNSDPNLYALRIGYAVLKNLKHPSARRNSSAQRLVQYMESIIANEQISEKALIQSRIDAFKAITGTPPSLLEEAEQALNKNELSTAYTLLMKYHTSLEELQAEVQKSQFKDISHMKDFWTAEFNKYVSSLFSRPENVRKDHYFDIKSDIGDLTIEDLVQKYIESIMGEGEINKGVEQIRQHMITPLQNYLVGVLGSAPKNVLDASVVEKVVESVVIKKPYLKHSTSTQKINIFTKQLIDVAAKGMGAELSTIAQERGYLKSTGRTGASFATGLARGLKASGSKTQIKGDVVTWEAASADIDLNPMIEDIAGALAKKDWDQVNIVRQKIDQLLKLSNKTIFEVVYNVKGYQSYRNYDIEKVDNFSLREGPLKVLAETGTLPTNALDKIIFLLHNTMQGCLFDKASSIETLKRYLSLFCAIWLFDDYSEVMSNIKNEGSGLKTIRVFRANNNYYVFSEMLQNVVNDLKKYIEKEQNPAEALVDIEIIPPSFNAQQYYQQLVSDTEMKYNEYLMNESEEGVQYILETRWASMRNKIMEEGTLSASVSQTKLAELLQLFEQLIGSK